MCASDESGGSGSFEVGYMRAMQRLVFFDGSKKLQVPDLRIVL